MRVSMNVRRSIAVAMAGSAAAVSLALPASAATTAPPAKEAVTAHVAPVKANVRLDITIAQSAVPAGARAILVKNVTTGATVGVYTLNQKTATHIVVTVPVGTTLDVSALSAANAKKPAGLGTVRVVVGGKGSTVSGNSVTITFRKGVKPVAAPSAQLKNLGAKISVR
ncbi:alginate regulatory protein AlgR3 [Parafrankia sp. EUN1f]|nr:alginate regulatory protein AlgR3 [Parafrankia sp. EUN1f]